GRRKELLVMLEVRQRRGDFLGADRQLGGRTKPGRRAGSARDLHRNSMSGEPFFEREVGGDRRREDGPDQEDSHASLRGDRKVPGFRLASIQRPSDAATRTRSSKTVDQPSGRAGKTPKQPQFASFSPRKTETADQPA